MRIFGALDAFAGSSRPGVRNRGAGGRAPSDLSGEASSPLSRLPAASGSPRPGRRHRHPPPSACGRRPCASARSRGSPRARAPPSVRLSACVSSSYKDTAHTGSRVAPPRYDFLLTNICSDPAAK